MKKKSFSKSGFVNTRNLLGVFLCLSGISLAILSVAGQRPTTKPLQPDAPAAPSPTGGTLTSANIGTANALNYMDPIGSATNETFFAGVGTCAVPQSCSTYTLTIDPSVGTASAGYDPTKYQIFIEIAWQHSAEDYDTFVCSTAGNCTQADPGGVNPNLVVAQNTSTADPEVIVLPTNIASGPYTINAVMATGAAEPYTGTVYLKAIPPTTGCTGNCTPPRYINYPAGLGQGDGAGEPSIGIDWNPNVASLKDTTSPDFTTGIKRLNTGGVAFVTMNGVGSTSNGPLGEAEWRVNFDDCSSPAINKWEDVSAIFAQESALIDPIGFVDHYTSVPLGLAYPEPHTTGRVFQLELIGGQGNSQGAYSDSDGNSYLPGANGGPGQGPDHETLGGGPYNPNSNPPPPPQAVAYGSPPNAIYYCSQTIVGEAECSRSDNGGQTFGPGVPIFQNPANCAGGIHGHVKVAPDGTVYVPNSSCGSPAGLSGVAVSQDNGLTWTENNVTGSFAGSQDPSVGVGQNNVGKVGTTNTIYVGYIDGGHPHIADSHDRGLTWEHNTDVGAGFGITHAVFPVVVAGDDNRAAFGFLGTGDGITDPSVGGTCDPYGATVNCENIWHLYIATTYDGGTNWITIDATPNDPVQKGTICLQGTTCPGPPTAPNTRNLLDFNDFTIDAEGRGLVVYADGCVNCDNEYAHGKQSGADHGTIARQSGGRRLFSHFDPIEPMPPASPQLVSAISQSPGALVTWLEPDNGGSPITGYNVYRSGTSGNETFLAHVSGEANTKYFDPTPVSGNNYYYAQAINDIGEGGHCGELLLGTAVGTICIPPGLPKLTDPAGDVDASCGFVNGLPAPPAIGADLLKFEIAQPYQPDGIPRLVFTLTTDNGQSPGRPGSSWYLAMKVPVSARAPNGFIAAHMTWKPATPQTPIFESYEPGPSAPNPVTGQVIYDGRFVKAGTERPAEATSNYLAPFNKVIIAVKASDLGLNPGDLISGFVSATTQTSDPANVGAGATCISDAMPNPDANGLLVFTGNYTVNDNQFCKPETFPVAVLGGSPLTGKAPLAVNFDGSGSSDADGDTIASYTLDFGDGTAPVTQASPLFSHTYNSNGDYPARLTVTDSRGKVSLSFSQLVISVDSTFNKAVSHKVHAFAGPFDFDLPLTGIPTIECRSGGTNNDYTIIYTFDRSLFSVGSATVTHGVGGGSGSVSGQTFGPNANQYTVNLTNVSNAQHLSVTLNDVHDTAGAILNNSVARMDVLVGDVNASGRVDSNDVFAVRQQSLQPLPPNGTGDPRADVDTSGRIDSNDVFRVRQQTLTGLP